MQTDRALRLLLTLAVVLAFLLVLAATLFFTEKLFVVWDHLKASPRPVFYGWMTLFVVLAGGSGVLILRLLLPRRRKAAPPAQALSESSVSERLATAEQRGVDVSAARQELESLGTRRAAGELYVAVFGEISTGKSSLIRALLPGTDLPVSVVGGSTREITHYEWSSPAGDRLILVDLPGLQEAGGELDAAAQAEAIRAQVVIYVCDNDLTREQHAELAVLVALGKPLVVALNKADRFATEDMDRIRERIRERVTALLAESPVTAGNSVVIDVVPISSGGVEQVVRIAADGTETTIERPRAAMLEPLKRALQWHLDRAPEALDQLRDAAVFQLVEQRLDEAEAAYRREQAAKLVPAYTRKAVVGAMAAVAPGSDLLIQGYLGASLVREMCALYDAPVRDIDVQQFLDIAQKHISRALPLLLAVAGNAAKAFPGLGTLAGGAMHAVAYGLIFDALGRALASTLEQGGLLRPVPAAQLFRENLSGNLEARTKRIARLALDSARERSDD